MTSTLSRRTPVSPGDDEAAFATVTEMFAMTQRSNHATAFAGWVVTTSAMGIVLQWGTIQVLAGSAPGRALLAALGPVAAALAYVVVLLTRAHNVTAGAQEDFHRFIATTPPEEPEFAAPAFRRLRLLTAAARHRTILTRSAVAWAYVAGTAFLAWSAAAMAIASGRS
jgi:copper oxidase (laccase) domain-containing protein